MVAANELSATGNHAPRGISDNLRYRLSDLLAFFEVDSAIAENVKHLLTRPNQGSSSGPRGLRIGSHVLVRASEFCLAYYSVTADLDRKAHS